MKTILEIILIPIIVIITIIVIIVGLLIAITPDYYEKEYISICEKDTSFNSIQECINEYKRMNW